MFHHDDKPARPASRWQQIADHLRTGITSGSMRPGMQLPTEARLAAQFSVNRHTVRRALSELANDGYVEATRGRGTFVAEHPIHYPIGARTRFSEIVSAQALQPGGRIISSSVEPAPAPIAGRLGVAAETPLIRLETLRIADGVPVIVGTLWFIAARVPNLIADYAETGSVSKSLEKAGFGDYRRQSTWISAALIDKADRPHLKLPAGSPVLIVESLNTDAAGDPLQFTRGRFAAGSVQVTVES